MAGYKPNDRIYKSYRESGSWICSQSPTGAHYWVITDKMRCKYCPEKRPIPEYQVGYHKAGAKK